MQSVLFVHPAADMYGASQTLLNLIDGLDRQRFRIVVLLPEKGRLLEELTHRGVKVLIEPALTVLRRNHMRWPGIVPFVLAIPRSITRVLRIIYSEHIDIVHTNTAVIFVAAFAAKVSRRPHVWHIRETLSEFPLFWQLYARIVVLFSDRIICISTAVREQFGMPGLPERRARKIALIFDGLDPARLENQLDDGSIRERFGIPKARRLIGLIGRINSWKGQELLLQAYASIADTPDMADTMLLIVGDVFAGNEHFLEHLQHLTYQLALQDRVIFTGFCDDIGAVLKELTVLVMPSQIPEPFGMVMLEGMYAGLPVIASDWGGPRDVIEHGVSGLLVQPGDPAALATAISRVLSDSEFARKLGAAARERIISAFSVRNSIEQITEIYTGLSCVSQSEGHLMTTSAQTEGSIAMLKRAVSHSILHPRYLAAQHLYTEIEQRSAVLTGKLLDIGCGKKPYRHLFSHVASYTGIDLASSMHGTIAIDCYASALNLPFPDSSYDSILCSEVLEHVCEPEIALREMLRVLKPGGHLLLTVPLSEPLHEQPDDYYRFTEYALTYLLNKVGFRVVNYTQRGGNWANMGYLLSRFMYHTIGSSRLPSGAARPRLALLPFILPLCVLTQAFFALVEHFKLDNATTMGYVFLAQKDQVAK